MLLRDCERNERRGAHRLDLADAAVRAHGPEDEGNAALLGDEQAQLVRLGQIDNRVQAKRLDGGGLQVSVNHGEDDAEDARLVQRRTVHDEHHALRNERVGCGNLQALLDDGPVDG